MNTQTITTIREAAAHLLRTGGFDALAAQVEAGEDMLAALKMARAWDKANRDKYNRAILLINEHGTTARFRG